uniref:Putative ovule protein n=1 Tax=Solanum chacoense TaxID=4108 RepID=A0A0V0H4G3_SOLCH
MHLDLSINKVPMSIHQPGNHKPETFTVKICIQNATAKQDSSTFLLLALKSYIYCPKVLQLFPGNTTGSRMTYSNLRNQRHSIGDSNLIRYLTSNSHMSIHHP